MGENGGWERGAREGMRVLVLGGSGMLGHKMVQRLSAAFPDTWWTLRGGTDDSALAPVPLLAGDHAIPHVDALDIAALESTVARIKPDVVVNCLGVIKQRPAAQAVIPSVTINALLPHRMAALLDGWGARLIHFSTDCVFSGKVGHYREDDHSDADDLYGRTKYIGEVAYPNSLTLRTSIIGRELRNHQSLLDWLLSRNHETVQGFRRAWWSGVTTNHLADFATDLLTRRPVLSGLYQLSSGRIAKYDLLLLLRDALKLDITVQPEDSTFCDRSLIGDRLQSAIGYVCPSWSELLSQLAADPTPYTKPVR